MGTFWTHRGHIIFHNRDRANAYIQHAGPLSADQIAKAQLGNLYLKNQQFTVAFNGMLKSGNGVAVGKPLAAHPAVRLPYGAQSHVAR